MSAPGVYLVRGDGVPGPGGCVCSEGVYLVPGVYLVRYPPCGQTHACKHITLPQTSFAGGKNTRMPNIANFVLVVQIEMNQTNEVTVSTVALNLTQDWDTEQKRGVKHTSEHTSASERKRRLKHSSEHTSASERKLRLKHTSEHTSASERKRRLKHSSEHTSASERKLRLKHSSEHTSASERKLRLKHTSEYTSVSERKLRLKHTSEHTSASASVQNTAF